ncbi:hypothetical protein K1T71_007991 [Dendrolimus kikuchii]|uniref:Uncharacterized protein n=1 Tax=Dendrolimus kikuchii TaxID=765133 RepID=A0ACC1D0A0_9NEOP|nr:hypothetical protein K1T71_007991 [Dendrolimus kikuchii]
MKSTFDDETYEDCSNDFGSPKFVQCSSTETGMSDIAIANEPVSEMYYTASSEVSLLSDTDIPERVQEDDSSDERRECVIAGHVAAMRERFESMTRTNTPCPDLARSMSPSLELFRNITPSPDRLG